MEEIPFFSDKLARPNTAGNKVLDRRSNIMMAGLEIFSEKDIINNSQNIIFLVLPWHFKSFILTNFKQLMDTGKVKIIFTLPKFEIYPKEGLVN